MCIRDRDYIDLYQLHWPERNTNFFGKLGYEHNDDDEWTKFEDILENLKTINEIPKKIKGNNVPSLFEIRGEIFLPLREFERLNKERAAEGLVLYANPRNTASGT